ncbi:hypothetical protein EON63_16035 [archaeon]|nr:MAG: hypothetical protein EON63_16035 [archaeon]
MLTIAICVCRRHYENCMVEQLEEQLAAILKHVHPAFLLPPLKAPLSKFTSPRYILLLRHMLRYIYNPINISASDPTPTPYTNLTHIYTPHTPPILPLPPTLATKLYEAAYICYNKAFAPAQSKTRTPYVLSKYMGLHHIDKGIYVDQVLRYVLNFKQKASSQVRNAIIPISIPIPIPISITISCRCSSCQPRCWRKTQDMLFI